MLIYLQNLDLGVGETTDVLTLSGSHALRTKNIRCVLRFRVFTVLERGSFIVINAFGVNSEDALGLVRFEKEEHPLRFSLLGIRVLERGTYIPSSAFGLSCFRNVSTLYR